MDHLVGHDLLRIVGQRGKADGLYMNTTGVGTLDAGIEISGANAKPGDVVILSGPIGDHGIAVLSARGELGFEADVQSDIAPLNHLIATLLNVSNEIHVLRDPTRGGVATTLNEIACRRLFLAALSISHSSGRLDSMVFMVLPEDLVGCCSLAAAQFRR